MDYHSAPFGVALEGLDQLQVPDEFRVTLVVQYLLHLRQSQVSLVRVVEPRPKQLSQVVQHTHYFAVALMLLERQKLDALDLEDILLLD